MKAGSSLQRVMTHQRMTATVPETGSNQPPYFPTMVLYWLFFCDRFKLISIILQKKSRRHINTTNGGERKPENVCFRGKIANKLVCKPSFIRTIPSTPEFHRVMHLRCAWVIPPIGNRNSRSSPCPEGYYSIVAFSINFLILLVNQIVKFIANLSDLIGSNCVKHRIGVR